MNKRELRLDKYGISKKRYKELCGFCEQYPEWKQFLADQSFISGIHYSDMPGNPNKGISNKTEKLAIKIANVESNCKLIERVAKMADSEYWECLIKAVCYEVPVNYLITYERIGIEKSAFYERRRYFFFLLDREK